jgi:hypothetical protein
MHLTFGEAYKIVCPDGRTVAPHSKDYSDIMELMRQSGHKPFQDKLITESVPKVPTNVLEAKQYIERVVTDGTPTHISKKQWLSVEVNKQAFLKHLALNSKK